MTNRYRSREREKEKERERERSGRRNDDDGGGNDNGDGEVAAAGGVEWGGGRGGDVVGCMTVGPGFSPSSALCILSFSLAAEPICPGSTLCI